MNPYRWFVLATLVLATWHISGAELKPAHVEHSPQSPRAGQKVTISLNQPSTQSANLEYQVVLPGSYIPLADPAFGKGHWTPVPMKKVAGQEGQWTAEIAGNLQTHRALVRYRIRGAAHGGDFQLPPADDTQPNYAYFVYDGIPSWKGAIDPSSWDPRKRSSTVFPAEVMSQVQTYFLIAREADVEDATWYQQTQGKEYRSTATFVAEGKVYDHVPFRARGGAWRYSMGKNMWKFNFNKGHHLEAKDDYGNRYPSKWGKLNLRSIIQQGDYGRRGEQGMYEAVGFRLFNLAGVDAPRTHWVSLRIIGEKEESPASQYQGDFWGLYLAIENEDGDFLQDHALPDGNVYKMMFYQGELMNQGKGQPTDRSDLQAFLMGLGRGTQSEKWWRANVDLPRYYSYRAIIEAIHHYDVGDGKNYDFYNNPGTGRWCVIPWDIDLTWGDHMYGSGREPFYHGVMGQPTLRLEYQNRLREIRDLLFNSEQTGRLIDECAAIIYRPGGPSIVDADRMKWDYHPIMASRYVMQGKTDKGLFYQSARTHDFPGMVAQMKEYVERRSAYIDRTLLGGAAAPAAPRIEYVGPAGYPINQLKFKAGEKKAPLEWRVGQIDRGSIAGKPRSPGHYEITPVWLSGELQPALDEIAVPSAQVQTNSLYRVRCRTRDNSGRWSHWSDPIEFSPGPARN